MLSRVFPNKRSRNGVMPLSTLCQRMQMILNAVTALALGLAKATHPLEQA